MDFNGFITSLSSFMVSSAGKGTWNEINLCWPYYWWLAKITPIFNSVLSIIFRVGSGAGACRR